MPGRDNALHVAELLCARMTHDFSGSVGALSNLLDLAFDQPGRSTEPLALACETAAQMVRRLRLLRAAWGTTMQALTLDRVRELAQGLGQPRYSVNLDALPTRATFSPELGRLLLNLLMLCVEALPSGGEIRVAGTADDVVLTIVGKRAGWPVGLTAAIADPGAAWDLLEDPRKVQIAFTVLLASAFRLRLSLMMGDGEGVPPLRLRPA